MAECLAFTEYRKNITKVPIIWQKRESECGCPRHMSLLGMMYGMGHGVVKSNKEATYWYVKGAESDDKYCTFYLGRFYEEIHDYEKALAAYSSPIVMNFGAVNFRIAHLIRRGNLPNFYGDELAYFQRAADDGYLFAIVELARVRYLKETKLIIKICKQIVTTQRKSEKIKLDRV